MPEISGTNREWFDRASVVIPGGVDSPVRSFRSVGGTPYTVTHGTGAYVVDVEGRRYIDLVQSYGASLLGHAHPIVVDAIGRAAAKGTTFGAPTPGEVLLAEAIVERVEGLEQVRLVSSGTEAVMSAVRVARGATGRRTIVKFDGCYHGHADHLLVAGGSGVAELGLPGSAGVTPGAIADTMVAPFNVVPTLDDDVACVIVEPVAANMNLVSPADGFLAGLRAECDRVGALLIFDEVITGFRVGPGGASGVSAVTPDLWCFGKVIGGGLPVGAFGSSSEIFRVLAPTGPVYQAGTLSGNPLATAAGLAVVTSVTADDYEELIARATRFGRGLEQAITSAGLFAHVAHAGPLVGLYVAPGDQSFSLPTNYAESRAVAETGAYQRLFHAALDRGVAMAPGAYEVMFPSFSHTDQILDEVIDHLGAAAAEVAASFR